MDEKTHEKIRFNRHEKTADMSQSEAVSPFRGVTKKDSNLHSSLHQNIKNDNDLFLSAFL
jgi:hypothetical protein